MNITTSLFLSLDKIEKQNIIEAIIFAASKDESLTLENIRNVILSDVIKEHNKIKRNAKTHPAINNYINNTENTSNNPEDTNTNEDTVEQNSYMEIIPLSEIEAFIENINRDLEQTNRPYRIVKFANCYQFATLSQYGEMVENMLTAKTKKRFTAAQLETLAIIAYKQPITKPEIDKIRGVMSSNEIINILIEKELITIAGRKEVIGKPLLYATTNEFLKIFGLNQLTDLPRLTEIEEIAEQKLREEEKTELILNVTAEDMPNIEIKDTIEQYATND